MGAQAKQAGPGLEREASFPASLEAAGPASPRLTIEEVSTHLGRHRAEAMTVLAVGEQRFVGKAASDDGRCPWELSATAAAAALQQYLQHLFVGPFTPQVQLLDALAFRTGIGQDAFAATVRIAHKGRLTDLHGSVLVRTDRSRAAAAVVLDAATRHLGRLAAEVAPKPKVELPGEPAKPERAASFEPPVRVGEQPREVVAPARPTRKDPEPPALVAAGFPAIGVSVGSSGIHTTAVDGRGVLLAEARRKLESGVEPDAALSLALDSVREVAAGMDGAGDLASIGLTLRGQLLEDEGVCLRCDDFPGWREVQLSAPFAAEFGRPVSCLSVAHAAAYAEYAFGAARGIADILYVLIGTDIDAGLVLEGKPALTRLAPGQAGHIVVEAGGPRCACGETGCWQALAARDALVSRALKAIRNGAPSAVGAAVANQASAVTPEAILRAAASGDAVARRALEETGAYLALGLTNLVALLGPQAVILEGQPPAFGTALLRAAEASLKSTARAGLLSHCVLLSPELGYAAAAIGVAAWAARHPV
ncbi:MAG: ROK family protein [Armatimonadota bacterium]